MNTTIPKGVVGPVVRLAAGAAMALTLSLAGDVQAAQHADPAPPPASTQSAPAAEQSVVPQDAHDAAAPAAGHGAADDQSHGAPTGDHGGAAAHGEAHGESLWATLARVLNIASLAGVLYAFGRAPLAAHLAARRAQIRKDLVDAAEMKQTAAARLAEIDARLAALPAELEALRVRSAEELEAERVRMRAAAEVERDRLVEQARREIGTQTRSARAQLRAFAATLAVDVAESRLKATLTPSEHAALVEGYASQMRNAQ